MFEWVEGAARVLFMGGVSDQPDSMAEAERQFQAFKRAQPSIIDSLTVSERLQLYAEMETIAAKIIANRPPHDPQS